MIGYHRNQITKEQGGRSSAIRRTALVLAVCLLFGLASCGGPDTAEPQTGSGRAVGLDPETQPAEETTAQTVPAPIEAPDFSGLGELQADPANGALARITSLPENSTVCSDILALQSLILCTGNTAETTAQILSAAGFEVLEQKNFDKPADSPAHTCAFTIAKTTVTFHGESRPLLLAAVRGTAGGEWYSNFDFAPSGNYDGVFAENFLMCAEDVLLSLNEWAQKEKAPLFLLCGHSRGAACANLSGLLANGIYGAENVFVYTFATPATLRGDAAVTEDNIFNYLNPGDLVPRLPLAAWGFRRAGTDIVLSGAEEAEAAFAGPMETLRGLAPTASDYYTVRHCLDKAGVGDEGLTAREVFLLIASALTGMGGGGNAPGAAADVTGLISADSDFAPLWDLLRGLGDNGWEKGKNLLAQHLPDLYGALIMERLGLKF